MAHVLTKYADDGVGSVQCYHIAVDGGEELEIPLGFTPMRIEVLEEGASLGDRVVHEWRASKPDFWAVYNYDSGDLTSTSFIPAASLTTLQFIDDADDEPEKLRFAGGYFDGNDVHVTVWR